MMICNTCTPVSELRFASDWLSLCLRRVAHMSAQRFAMDMMDDAHALAIYQHRFHPTCSFDGASTRRAVQTDLALPQCKKTQCHTSCMQKYTIRIQVYSHALVCRYEHARATYLSTTVHINLSLSLCMYIYIYYTLLSLSLSVHKYIALCIIHRSNMYTYAGSV